MKVLSVRQPWAWAIVNGHKPVENRTWNTKVRGPILIHAGRKWDPDGQRWINTHFPELIIPNLYVGNGMGGVVGTANIIGVVNQMPSKWFFGPYGFVLDSAAPLPFYPCPGKLGFFDIPLPPGYPAYLECWARGA